MDAKKHSGRLSISLVRGDDTIRMTLTDSSSRCELVEIAASKTDFADALFGLYSVPCEYEYHADCPVGKRREVKSEAVFVPDCNLLSASERAAVIRSAVAAHEADGWKGFDGDAENRHNVTDGSPPPGMNGRFYRVTFIRFVDPE